MVNDKRTNSTTGYSAQTVAGQIVEPVIYDRNEHTISRQSIDSDALKILYRLLRAGYKAYLVGGGVRDLLLGLRPKDFDIGTDAEPNEIRALFRNSRVIGRRFRLVHVFFRGNKIIEVATFRANDVDDSAESPDGSAPQENIYGSDATDAFRRDLTINALFYDLATFSVIDYVGGVRDLKDGIIRMIGDPDQRFREDPVRLIRTVRHAARTGFRIEPVTWDALLRNRHLISESSQVRVYEELRKDFRSGHALKILRALDDSSLLELLIPEVSGKNRVFLGEGSRLAMALARLDKYIKHGQDVSTTVVLSLITVFHIAADVTEPLSVDRFSSKEDLRALCSSVFEKLAVPRKERERIMIMLFAWYSLMRTDARKIRAATYAHKAYRDDLYTFLEAIRSSEHDDEILNALTHAERHAKPPRPAARRKRRRPRHQRTPGRIRSL